MENIEQLKGKVDLKTLCKIFGIGRASWHRNQNKKTQPKNQDNKTPRKPQGAALQRAYPLEHRQLVVAEMNKEENADLAVPQIFAKWLDRGIYWGSIRTLYRFLAAENQVVERRRVRRHGNYKKPELLATAPNQVWSWDITYLKSPVRGVFYYLYVILDIFSRYAVGWMVAERESLDLAQRLLLITLERQGVDPKNITVHSDRGSVMKALSLPQKIKDMGIEFSYSRPHVSNDNPFSESQFKTMKYGPLYPERFNSLPDAVSFGQNFFGWYNQEHHHSGIDLMTPAQVHFGQGEKIAEGRNELMESVFNTNPERFVQGRVKKYRVPTDVWINPPKPTQGMGVQPCIIVG